MLYLQDYTDNIVHYRKHIEERGMAVPLRIQQICITEALSIVLCQRWWHGVYSLDTVSTKSRLWMMKCVYVYIVTKADGESKSIWEWTLFIFFQVCWEPTACVLIYSCLSCFGNKSYTKPPKLLGSENLFTKTHVVKNHLETTYNIRIIIKLGVQ